MQARAFYNLAPEFKARGRGRPAYQYVVARQGLWQRLLAALGA